MSATCDYLVDTFPLTYHGEAALGCLRPEGHTGAHVVKNARGDFFCWEADACDCNEGGCGCIVYGEVTEDEAQAWIAPTA